MEYTGGAVLESSIETFLLGTQFEVTSNMIESWESQKMINLRKDFLEEDKTKKYRGCLIFEREVVI